MSALPRIDQGALQRLAAWLDESVMGFLALAALAAGVAPLIFRLSADAEWYCEIAGWCVVALFALEYAVNLALAADRSAFARDPWRVLDAVIIAASLGSLLPAVSEAARLGPALRILRLFRILLFGARAGHGLRRPVLPPPRAAPTGEPRVSVLRPGESVPHGGAWGDLLRWAASPESDWLHASNLSAERLREVARSAGVPHVLVEAALNESSYPRIEPGEHWSSLTVSMPAAGGAGQRDPLLMLVTANDVLSLAMHPLDVQGPPPETHGLPWGPRCVLHVLRRVLDRNEDLAGTLERDVRRLEELPPGTSPASFFEETFRLKRTLSAAKGDLWRLRGLIEMLADGRRTLPGLPPGARDILRELADEADYLHETVEDIREAVISLIELHINIAGHDMNRFMRLLAIVSGLALIPAVAGGLLGMNLADSPWAVTLGEVAFVTLVLMLGVLYAFMAKGWLK